MFKAVIGILGKILKNRICKTGSGDLQLCVLDLKCIFVTKRKPKSQNVLFIKMKDKREAHSSSYLKSF